MTSDSPAQGAADVSSSGSEQILRPLRWPWRAGAAALSAFGASTLLYPRYPGPTVVVLGVDGFGWSYVFGVATALLAALFIGGILYAVVQQHHTWWAELLQTLGTAALLITLVVAAPIALLGGALSFKNSYREIGSVDGRTIVVQQFAGWRGADSLNAGYRNGPLVTFASRSNTTLHRTLTDISTWQFDVTANGTTVQVHYSSSDTPIQTGTLVLKETSRTAPLLSN